MSKRFRSPEPARALFLLACVGAGGCFEPSADENGMAMQTESSGSGETGGSTGGSADASSGTSTGSTGGGTDSTSGSSGETGTRADTGSTSGGSDESGSPMCAADEACTPAIPPDWEGPVAFVEDADNVACPDALPDPVQQGHTQLDVPAMSCECSCSDPSDFTCPPLSLWEQDGACNDENFFPVEHAVSNNTCIDLTPNNAVSWLQDPNDVPDIQGGSCNPVENHSIPAPQWIDSVKTCGGSRDAGTCEGGGSCVAADVEAPVCIQRVGDHECPATWTERTVFFRAFEDARTCTACSCGDPSGPCDGAFIFWGDDGCSADLVGVLGTDESCFDTTQATHVEFLPAANNAECQPSGGAETGSASPLDPVTICCLP